MKKVLCLLCLFIFGIALTACQTPEVSNDKLVIGMECGYQPFNWTTNTESEYTLPISGSNKYVDGFDVQIAKYLAESLGREVVIKKIEWDGLIPALQNGEINMILAGMTDTPARRESIDFTTTYLSSDLAFLVKTENLPEGNSRENPLSYQELLELFKDKSLICQANVVGDGYIADYFANQEGYNIHHNSPAATYPLAAYDVKSGAAFAMPAELPVIEAMTNLGGLSVLYVDYSFLSADDLNGLTVSIGIKKGNTELCEALNEALNKLSNEQKALWMGEAATRSASNA